MSSRGGKRIKMVTRKNTTSQHQRVQQAPPVVPQPVTVPPTIDLDAIEDVDDDVVESTASAFAQVCSFIHILAKNKSRGTLQGTLRVDVESGGRLTKKRKSSPSDQANVNRDEVNKSSKSAVVAPVEEPNCPICMCPFTEETTTKCGHIFCNSCIKNAISRQATCPTCRKKVSAKHLIRVFLPTAR